MAAPKKTTVNVAAAKVEEPKNEVKKAVTAEATEVKAEAAKATEKPNEAVKAVKAETAKTEPVKKETVKKETAKKETVKKETAKKETVKKETTKKAATVKKAAVENELHIQFGGKSYSQEDLVKIAKDVWEYDLNNKAEDLKSVELYVKPEENMVYYVMNKDIAGSFYI